MALRNERQTTAAIPEGKLVISMPGITWLANNTANPVIAHRIKNPFMPASYRPCGHGLKPCPPVFRESSLGHSCSLESFFYSGIGQSSPQCTQKNRSQGNKNKASHDTHQHFPNPKGHPEVKDQNAVIEAYTSQQFPYHYLPGNRI